MTFEYEKTHSEQRAGSRKQVEVEPVLRPIRDRIALAQAEPRETSGEGMSLLPEASIGQAVSRAKAAYGCFWRAVCIFYVQRRAWEPVIQNFYVHLIALSGRPRRELNAHDTRVGGADGVKALSKVADV